MFIDKQGNLVIAPQYESANIFKYGLAEASKDILMTYINKVGKIIWQEMKL
ncbi:MAG: WG repeat-containing protein [Candidatus Latescibacteria bacterium]|nr:WG repeat-containing protein [Candidatus Latescibacterota bacterium]